MKVRSLSLLLPVSRIKDDWPGGIASFRRDYPACRTDGGLVLFEFDDEQSAGRTIGKLERDNFRFDPGGYESDIARVDPATDSDSPCPWLRLTPVTPGDDPGLSGASGPAQPVLDATVIESEVPFTPEAWEP